MSHSAVRLDDGDNFVEICCLEVGAVPGMSDGDLRLGVAVRSGTFTGAYDAVWIAHTEWQQFISSLTALERGRHGRASVAAMSPNEFELTIEIVSAAGRLTAHGFLARHFWLPPSSAARLSRIEFGLVLDPSLPRVLLEQFASLGSPVV